jgi:hypothetical protein
LRCGGKAFLFVGIGQGCLRAVYDAGMKKAESPAGLSAFQIRHALPPNGKAGEIAAYQRSGQVIP